MTLPGPKTSMVFTQLGTTPTDDGTGVPSYPETTYATVDVILVQLSATEQVLAAQATEVSTHKAIMPYTSTNAGITNKMKATAGTRVFDIVSSDNPGEMNLTIELKLKEVVQG